MIACYRYVIMILVPIIILCMSLNIEGFKLVPPKAKTHRSSKGSKGLYCKHFEHFDNGQDATHETNERKEGAPFDPMARLPSRFLAILLATQISLLSPSQVEAASLPLSSSTSSDVAAVSIVKANTVKSATDSTGIVDASSDETSEKCPEDFFESLLHRIEDKKYWLGSYAVLLAIYFAYLKINDPNKDYSDKYHVYDSKYLNKLEAYRREDRDFDRSERAEKHLRLNIQLAISVASLVLHTLYF